MLFLRFFTPFRENALELLYTMRLSIKEGQSLIRSGEVARCRGMVQ